MYAQYAQYARSKTENLKLFCYGNLKFSCIYGILSIMNKKFIIDESFI